MPAPLRSLAVCECNADGAAAAQVTEKKKKGKPRGRPFQRKEALCVPTSSENMSPHALSVPLDVCVAVLAGDSIPDGLLVEAVVAEPQH